MSVSLKACVKVLSMSTVCGVQLVRTLSMSTLSPATMDTCHGALAA